MSSLVENIKAMRLKQRFTQSYIAEAVGCDVSNWSKIEQGKQKVQVEDLEKIATCLGVRVIDLFTYPDIYVKKTDSNVEKVTISFEVTTEERDFILDHIQKKVVQ